MLNQIHISKGMSKSFISDFGIAFFHALHSLSHWQLSWGSAFQSVIIHRNLYRTMIQITTMHQGIDNQLTNGIRWNLINILAINPHNGKGMHFSQGYAKYWKRIKDRYPEILEGTTAKYFNRETIEGYMTAASKEKFPEIHGLEHFTVFFTDYELTDESLWTTDTPWGTVWKGNADYTHKGDF